MNLRHEDSDAGAGAGEFADDAALPCILVVDDSAACRDMMVSLVRTCGFRAISAQDGLDAQLLLRTENPALVISDLQMPLCSGWELLSFCHAHRPLLPVLLVSGLPLGRRPAIEGWAAGSLEKPIDASLLRTEIARLTSRAVSRP